jgi:hypothetical protein
VAALDARRLVPLELPRRIAPDVDVELVEPWIVAVAGENRTLRVTLADPVTKAALEIARRWREEGTENAIADILAERDGLRAALLQAVNYLTYLQASGDLVPAERIRVKELRDVLDRAALGRPGSKPSTS